MDIYVTVVFIIIVICSTALAYVLGKNNLLNINILLAIAISSIVVSLSFPYVLGLFNSLAISSDIVFNREISIIWAFLITVTIYIFLISALSVLISVVIPDKKSTEVSEGINNFISAHLSIQELHRITGALNKLSVSFIKFLHDKTRYVINLPSKKKLHEYTEPVEADSAAETASTGIDVGGGEQLAGTSVSPKEVYCQINGAENPESYSQPVDMQNMSAEEKNILEKSVDSEKNIDKMGIETIYGENSDVDKEMYADDNPDMSLPVVEVPKEFSEVAENREKIEENTLPEKEKMAESDGGVPGEIFYVKECVAGGDNIRTETVDTQDIEDCIDKAFGLKESGDFEGAILYYMYALEKEPDNDVVFWIVLDICALYKQLGQTELAKDILESYASSFGNIMSQDIKAEIEKNLL